MLPQIGGGGRKGLARPKKTAAQDCGSISVCVTEPVCVRTKDESEVS